MELKPTIIRLLHCFGFACLLGPSIILLISYIDCGPGIMIVNTNVVGEWLPELILFACGVFYGLYVLFWAREVKL